MWNLIIRLGMALSTLLLARQAVDRFWPGELHPTRLYRPHQVARYLGTTTDRILELIQEGDLSVKWMDGRPLILGMSILQFLSRSQ